MTSRMQTQLENQLKILGKFIMYKIHRMLCGHCSTGLARNILKKQASFF